MAAGPKQAIPMTRAIRERLRKVYIPERVQILFVGEAPPASGRFFYRANSGLYHAIRHTFIASCPKLRQSDFLEAFRSMGCYLVDLCGNPVDRLASADRRKACIEGEVRLAKTLVRLRPEIVITLVLSIASNVRRAQKLAEWSGDRLELPYPGRWHSHRVIFQRKLVPVLRKRCV
jgi:hypothetical protein